MTLNKNKRSWVMVCLLVVVVMSLYRYSPYKIQFIGHYDKIWAHRTNSSEKLKSAVRHFKGVELDLVYDLDKDFLDVNHPPAESIGLDFKSYISNLETDQKPYMWLDIKNLNVENSNAIFNKLVNILKSQNYPQNKILIESDHPETLKMFSDYGFMTSYYLPYGLNLKSKSELESDIASIKRTLKSQPQLGISTEYLDYDILKKYFPTRKKYIWILVSSFSTEFKTISKILNDEKVEVVLVNYKALQGNR